MPSLNPLMPPMNSMNDKSVMNMMPNFDDPLEQSLASFEQPLACKFFTIHILSNQSKTSNKRSNIFF